MAGGRITFLVAGEVVGSLAAMGLIFADRTPVYSKWGIQVNLSTNGLTSLDVHFPDAVFQTNVIFGPQWNDGMHADN